MALIVKNNVSGELASGITDVATSVTLTDATDFPDPGADYYFATLSTPDESDWEIVKVTAKATNTLTIERAQESGTDSRLAARAWSAGDKIELRLTAGMYAAKVDAPPSDGNYYAYKDGAWVNITNKIINP
jgi:hypothetical protein